MARIAGIQSGTGLEVVYSSAADLSGRLVVTIGDPDTEANIAAVDSSGRLAILDSGVLDKTVNSTVMNAAGSVVNVSAEGYQGLIFHVTNAALVGALQVKASGDGGTTYGLLTYFGSSGTNVPTYVQTAGYSYVSDTSTFDIYVLPVPGATHYQLSFSSYTSGTATVTARTSSMPWQYGPPVVTTGGTYNGNYGPFLRVGGQGLDYNDRFLTLNNATAPGTSDWALMTRDQANMGQFVLANAVTSPASASTVVQSSGIITGLDKFRSLMITARLLGATGGTLDVYLQGSVDGGTTWTDLVHFPQLAAAATAKGYVVQLSKGVGSGAAPVVVNSADGTPTMAVNVAAQGDFADRLRYVFVAGASTTTGAAQTIKLSGTT